MAAEDDLKALEDRRIKACIARDRAALETLFDDHMTHVHTTGLTENRAEMIEGFMTRIKIEKIERADLKIHVFGDAAVMVGPMYTELTVGADDLRKIKSRVTQVAKKGADGWRFVAYQATIDVTQK
jgi:ketosteroid isomerase-like protein